MEKRFIHEIENQIRDSRIQAAAQLDRLKEISDCEKFQLKRKQSTCGNWLYCAINKENKQQSYLGKDEVAMVAAIKEYRYLNQSTRIINRNIEILSKALESLKEDDYDSINSLLPETYRNPVIKGMCSGCDKTAGWKEKAEALKARYEIYRPEELTITTDDGNLVRSKSEGLIYNYLLSAGVTFIYELPMKLRTGTMWPDFTLLSEQDYKTEIIIEHQGMMGYDFYRKSFADKVFKYIQEGYVQGQNIFYTFDSADGGLDITPVKDILRSKIKLSV